MLTLLAALTLCAFQDDVDREVQRLKRRLELTEEQETKIREILRKEAEAKKEKDAKIRETLTEEQRKKYDDRRGVGHPMMDVEDMLKGVEKQFGDLSQRWSTGKSLQKELNLTDDQVKRIDEIARENGAGVMQWSFDGNNFDPAEFQKQQQEKHKALGDKIKPVLTDEQKPKFDEIWAKRAPGGMQVARGVDAPHRAEAPADRTKRVMQALKCESADEAAAIRQLVEKVATHQKEASEHRDKTTKRVRELAKDEAASEESVAKELETLREERRAIEKKLATAQKDLREIVTYKQELALIEHGILK